MDANESIGRIAVGSGGVASAAAAGVASGARASELGLAGQRRRGAVSGSFARSFAAWARGASGRSGASGSSSASRRSGASGWSGTSCYQLGFTAIELLVALAVAGVLLVVAVPGFAALARSVGLSSAANELLTALHLARSSAVLRGVPVALCLTADDRTCVAAADSAATGWLVFVPDGSAVASRPAVVGEVLSRFHLPERLTVSASRPTVTFWPVTRAAATSTFDLCDLAGAGRSIIVSQTGRPRVAAEATSCA